MRPWTNYLNFLSLIPNLQNELIISTLVGCCEYQMRWVIHGEGFSKLRSKHVVVVCCYFPIVSPSHFCSQ